MAGQAQMIRLLAMACRGESFTTEEVSTGNMSRRDILLPLLSVSDEEILKGSREATAYLAKNKNEQANTPSTAGDRPEEQRHPPPTSIRWSTFVFPAPALQALKAAVSATIPPPAQEGGEERVPFISTDDALSALLWQSITRTFDVASLANKPLGAVAASLRARLRPDEVRDGIRAHATKLAANTQGGVGVRVRVSSNTNNNHGLGPLTGVNLSSWAKEPCYDFDFGEVAMDSGEGGEGGSSKLPGLVLGRPAVVQRPVFTDDAWEGVVYLMPRRPDGEIAVLACLREEDMERMREDRELAKYGRHVG
ncbi:trichothecene 3-O-acetyltransferase [Apiospora saccharicola]